MRARCCPCADAGVATRVVGDDLRARRDGAFDEATERVGAAIDHDGEPNTPGVTAALALVELGALFALADLDSGGDQHFVGDAPALAARSTADIGFIDHVVVRRLFSFFATLIIIPAYLPLFAFQRIRESVFYSRRCGVEKLAEPQRT